MNTNSRESMATSSTPSSASSLSKSKTPIRTLCRLPSCQILRFVYVSCMPNKTITLEIDAYEKLRSAKRGGESFTAVVRRAVIPDAAPTGKSLRDHYRSGGGKVSDEYLDAVGKASAHDPIPDDPWA
jgi:hypothetical protein